MRKLTTPSFLLSALLMIGCSNSSVPSNVSVIPPELQIRQVGGTAFAARHEQGNIPLRFEIDILNKTAEPITLERIEMQSLGEGAYTLNNVSKPFDRRLDPDRVETVELFAPAYVNKTILGGNGPVTLRATAYFKSSLGSFRQVYIQQVNDRMTPPKRPN